MNAFYVTPFYVAGLHEKEESGPFLNGRHGRLSQDWDKAIRADLLAEERRVHGEYGYYPSRAGKAYAVWELQDRPLSVSEAARMVKDRKPDAIYMIQYPEGWKYVILDPAYIEATEIGEGEVGHD